MRRIEKRNQMRRDFTGVYQCEACGHVQEGNGYDDTYFHHSVIPAMTCKSCGESTKSLGTDAQPWATKYPDSQVV
jgi:primosomal protein N'